MRLIRLGDDGSETPGVLLEDDRRIDVSGFGSDYDEAFFASDGIARLRTWLAQNASRAPVVPQDVRLGPPLCRPSKIVCIGLNYSDHARESGMAVPAEPVVFLKATTAIAGPNDDVVIPKHGSKVDWEVELAVVIGQRASYIEEQDANACIAGYLLHNDYSERSFQLERGGQWVKGKSCDTFAPLGPWLATPDEIPNVHDLRLWLRVNGTLKQSGTTRELIFTVPKLVSYVSHFMTLLPGDIISTGTPAGVAFGKEPAQYLREGDVVELGIDGLGEARQRLTACV